MLIKPIAKDDRLAGRRKERVHIGHRAADLGVDLQVCAAADVERRAAENLQALRAAGAAQVECLGVASGVVIVLEAIDQRERVFCPTCPTTKCPTPKFAVETPAAPRSSPATSSVCTPVPT